MRAVVQRVTRARVVVEGSEVGSIEHGLLVLVGVGHDDTGADAATLAGKLAQLRVFRDGDGKMNHSVRDVGGAVLVVSQFTLFGATRRGNRPSFTDAAKPELARRLVNEVVQRLRHEGLTVATGEFGAMMKVDLVNDGPVTLLIETVDGRIR